MDNSVGRIVKGVAGTYTVIMGTDRLECKPRGKFRMKHMTPMVGDFVEVQLPDNPGQQGYLLDILERKNSLSRPAVSNIDIMFLVIAVKNPDPDLLLLDRLLIICHMKNIDCVLCINKCDIGQPEELRLLTEQYSAFKVIQTSATKHLGIDEIESQMQGQCGCFAGQSGVGKSSLLNAMIPDLRAQTGDISEKTHRGRHTTRHVELLPFGETGFLVDTPGFSLLDLETVDPSVIMEHYPEFLPYRGQCRFQGCKHDKEPGCAVKSAVQDGRIHLQRYERYIELYHQMQEEWKVRYD